MKEKDAKPPFRSGRQEFGANRAAPVDPVFGGTPGMVPVEKSRPGATWRVVSIIGAHESDFRPFVLFFLECSSR